MAVQAICCCAVLFGGMSVASAGAIATTESTAGSEQPLLAKAERPPETSATKRSEYSDLLTREAKARGLPAEIATAVAFVESGFNPSAVGSVGELGLMQVRPATATMLGHTGPAAALLDPATNVRFGIAYLARAWTLARGDLCRALMKYRAGHGEERMTARSVEYCRRARDRLAATGSPLATATLPTVQDASGRRPVALSAGQSDRQAVLATVAARLWAEHAARVRAIAVRADRVMKGS